MEGSCPGDRAQPKLNASKNPKGIQYSAILDLKIGGHSGMIKVTDDQKLKVEGSDWAVLVLAASSSFDGPFTNPSDSKKDPTLMSLNTLNMVKTLSFSELFTRHFVDYQNLFNRVSLQLEGRSQGSVRTLKPSETDFQKQLSKDVVSTAERVKSFKLDEDPSLIELLFNYGRYLLISCSRPGTQVANLQGIWNKDTEPAWDAAPHLNINLPMNYWPSLSCHLSECQEPLFDYIASLAVNGAKTARVSFTFLPQ
ncbi:alpha-L-fucosidase 2-like [Asparagus officinalis]|uniref:alpha-L-fucosidase 2-like n=1 Tax=Asparagus officinalis TaxID=4686 RepID=UPI00098E6937|nr:alpha-L-fucosidase 2-like [Asparagus officinalis]